MLIILERNDIKDVHNKLNEKKQTNYKMTPKKPRAKGFKTSQESHASCSVT